MAYSDKVLDFERIKSDLSIVFDRDPAARSYLEILTAYPGVHAIIIHRLAQCGNNR